MPNSSKNKSTNKPDSFEKFENLMKNLISVKPNQTRKRFCSECKKEIKPGDSWERHSYKKQRFLYCGNCADRINREEAEAYDTQDYRYP